MIHQVHIRHDEAEDRLLLRLTTTDHLEFRFWLTRRFTKRLWRMLAQMLEWDRAVKQQIDPDTRHAVLDLQHEAYSQEADFATAFSEEAPRSTPLGDAPVLLARAEGTRRDSGGHLLKLRPLSGQGIDMTMDNKLLHIFMRLLREQVAKTDWDLNLALYEASPEAVP